LLYLAISEDAETWHAGLILDNEPRAEFSYPAVIQTSDGMVHVTWTWKRQRIVHAVVDPQQLRPVPFVDGGWPK